MKREGRQRRGGGWKWRKEKEAEEKRERDKKEAEERREERLLTTQMIANMNQQTTQMSMVFAELMKHFLDMGKKP
jgi:hypothetical protein